ncbi:MAG: BlaI/MecI/CopY family transcriptional regulator [Bacteroidales bacterium]
MKPITRSQEEILQVLWDIQDGAVTDVIQKLPDPKPAYTTVATVIKVLEKKGYVSHKTYGRTHVYFPLVNRKEYARHVMKGSVKVLFDNSVNQLVSFFVRQRNLSLNELEELRKMIEEEIKNKKKEESEKISPSK